VAESLLRVSRDAWRERWEDAHNTLFRYLKALEKLRGYNVAIAASQINYRPEDHIAVIDAALALEPQAEAPAKDAGPSDAEMLDAIERNQWSVCFYAGCGGRVDTLSPGNARLLTTGQSVRDAIRAAMKELSATEARHGS
jgi:hypothetical protein